MNTIVANGLRHLTFDKVALSFISMSAVVVIGDAYMTSTLNDAQSPSECIYPPMHKFITREHIRELEKNNFVVIDNILPAQTLHSSRLDIIENLRTKMKSTNHQNDSTTRQDQIICIQEKENNEKLELGIDLIHCIKLLRGIPYILEKFGYSKSQKYVIPRKCQLSQYSPDSSLGYVRHKDRCDFSFFEMGLLGWLRASDYRHRVITAILYLNTPHWNSGGELRIFLQNVDGDGEEYLDVVPSGGKLILFDSSKVEHQVLASREDRYALTCWFNGDMVTHYNQKNGGKEKSIN
eukprot:CAMPEP_0178960502 /NCGR_PEP_ID=MMETSP0789-20121207/13003_1 /TAXON_ID=3005 /ORGANISM="Rhizosolenia setigera, Strain CCMP 1694" /LENGTH=292 /DNA_ID=CAMNT_0020643865 /DNA_START=53 /DNA_END=931 /DNA_ORIENTATION=-